MNGTLEQTLGGTPRKSFWADGMVIVWFLAFANFLMHVYFNNRYGYFRDEFDYMACGDNLSWGFVDHPPLIPFLAKLSRLVLGDSLRSIRFVPALAVSAAVILIGMIARELGGRRFGVVLAALAFMISPISLSAGSLLTTNCLEPLLWMGCVYFLILAIQRENPRYWLWFGAVAGIGLEEKYSIAILGFAIVVGLLLTAQRRVFAQQWVYLGGALAFLVFLPNLLWNVRNHWPFAELMHNIKAEGRDIVLSPLEYFAQQLLIIHPVLAPIWIIGILAFLFATRWRPLRFLGWCYLVAFATFVVLKGKNYYLGPIYGVYFAAGAVVIESFIEQKRQAWLKPVLIVVLIVAGAWIAPVVMPVLPVDQFISYMDKLPFKVPRSEHSHFRAVLPQHYADQFGWEEIVVKTAEVYQSIPADERAGCGIFAQDYGQAGAIDFFGKRYGLPPALSGHQSYFLWGPRGFSGSCLIVLDDKKEVLEGLFERVEYKGRSADNPYALEKEIPVYLCHGAKFGTMEKLWPAVKKWG